jgi:hypothetical protein
MPRVDSLISSALRQLVFERLKVRWIENARCEMTPRQKSISSGAKTRSDETLWEDQLLRLDAPA